AWHHTRGGHNHDGNYGNTLVWWDRLFGSEVTQDTLPPLFGIGGDQALAGTREQGFSPMRLAGAAISLQFLRRRADDEAA
ncbi:MAG: sterol desaturase/sphingolipid hydroxylase (fatty acid hydroxylase superfamily), partial [Myxococcota bacterium]